MEPGVEMQSSLTLMITPMVEMMMPIKKMMVKGIEVSKANPTHIHTHTHTHTLYPPVAIYSLQLVGNYDVFIEEPIHACHNYMKIQGL